MNIYVLYVLSGQEQRTAAALADSGLHAFVPIEGCYIHQRGKWTLEERPLFPGYVFVETDLTDHIYHQLRHAPGVVRMLPSNEKPAPVFAHEIPLIHELHTQLRTPSVVEYLDNHTYRIVSGYLLSHQHRIKKLNRHKRRALVQVTILGETKTLNLSYQPIGSRSSPL